MLFRNIFELSSIDIFGKRSELRKINQIPMKKRPIGKIYPPQPKSVFTNVIQPPNKPTCEIETRPNRVIKPTMAKTTPIISSLRSRERSLQYDITGFRPGSCFPPAPAPFLLDCELLLRPEVERVKALVCLREPDFLERDFPVVFRFCAIELVFLIRKLNLDDLFGAYHWKGKIPWFRSDPNWQPD